MKRSVLVSGGTVAVLVASVAGALPAEAGTPSWLSVRTATKITAYNGGKAAVPAKATAHGARVITALRVTAYRGKKKVASGKSVHLKPGTYRTVTSGKYRAYRMVSVARTRRVLHEGDFTTATCRVTNAVDDGSGFTESTATCSHPYFPAQHPTDTEYDNYQVGDTYSTYVVFNDEYVTQRYATRQRSYGRTTSFTSAKRKLVVRKGGFRKVYRGTGGVDTNNFRVSKNSWRVSYHFSCGDWTNYIVWLHKSNGDLVDLVANELDTSGSGSVREHGTGKYYLEIDTDSSCSWQVTVR